QHCALTTSRITHLGQEPSLPGRQHMGHFLQQPVSLRIHLFLLPEHCRRYISHNRKNCSYREKVDLADHKELSWDCCMHTCKQTQNITRLSPIMFCYIQ
uniref:Uncharacterized protein n=1 Tax=Anas platyrhynchos platyrhynchos TaxID=8840 RepID=A0A493TGU5_ANAPP